VASQTNCGQPVDYVKVSVKVDLENFKSSICGKFNLQGKQFKWDKVAFPHSIASQDV
jgi:hypothetical protein